MKANIIFLDDKKICESLKEEHNLIYVENLELLKNELKNTKLDLLVYNSKLQFSIHSIITILLKNNLNNIPILTLGSTEDIDYNLIFGPFSSDSSLEQIIELALSYKKVYSDNLKLKEDNSYLREGILSKKEEDTIKNIEKFSTMITQEFKRFKRLNKDISIIIIESFCTDIKNYSSDYIESLFKDLLTIIRESMREVDIILSYDKNKLLILMPDTDKEQLAVVSNRIENIKDDFNNRNLDVKFDLTLFNATSDNSISSFSQLVTKALKG